MNQATTRIAVCVIAFVLAFQLDAAKAESPASTSPTPTMGEFFSGLNPMNWKMPNFKSVLPGQDETARIKEKKDGLVSDVSATASRSWQRTKEVLDPRRLSPSNWLPAQSESPQSESPGFFSSLFGGKAEAEADSERVATVGDFLAQPKITR
ncbi:hypothetical protein Pla52o_40550 [Novipirellula galeiformis]|uniref:Uncharacterized protein n=1 Tax=Novipirellula galeiformis TaxID=2528004 RepID=A0A5C6C8K4_9BACT|nr:hypothetical protein [Novipirellula galeiformis]TWU21023.1 hypothetical protein Pla52o_40550 [Novipirellula galeiformis]